MNGNRTTAVDGEGARRFVERFASALIDGGMARMPARVFSALLASDAGRLTAGELADQLGASPAAISGAVRYLRQIGMARREREPGARRDSIIVDYDLWYEASLSRDKQLSRYEVSLREGIAALGPDSPAGMRLTETLAFFEFVQAEMPEILVRWRAIKKRLSERSIDT